MKTLRTTLILTYVVLVALLLLQRCERPATPSETPETPSQADSTIVRRAREVGGEGSLKITLLWDWYADVDLHVVEPNGTELYFRNTQDTATGGSLDHDDIEGGPDSAENICWEAPPSGDYEVSLVLYRAKGDFHGPCTVIVFQEGHDPMRYEVSLSPLKKRRAVCTVTVP